MSNNDNWKKCCYVAKQSDKIQTGNFWDAENGKKVFMLKCILWNF